jgi:hypothetical protein
MYKHGYNDNIERNIYNVIHVIRNY